MEKPKPGPDYIMMTPHRAVGFLSQKGIIIELKVGRLSSSNETTDRSHLWRCEITCGDIKGICDSKRKVVAREMASEQFLVNLKKVFPYASIPHYEVPSELFIDPSVFRWVEDEAANRLLDVCHEIRTNIPTFHSEETKKRPWYTFTCTYYIGTDTTFTDTNLYLENAKLNAAVKTFEHIAEKKLLPTPHFTGDQCDPDVKYDFIESEVYQTIMKTETD